MNVKKAKIFSWLLVIIWMAVIFYLSAQVAAESNHLSSGITKIIVRILEKIGSNFNIDLINLNYIVRKNAHFTAYLILGFLVVDAMRKSKICGFKGYTFAFLFCVLYALSDEFHQLFIPGRSGELRDVFIDSFGVAIGITFFYGLKKIKNGKMKVDLVN